MELYGSADHQGAPLCRAKTSNARVEAIGKARQAIMVSVSGVLWSQAWDEMRAFVE